MASENGGVRWGVLVSRLLGLAVFVLAFFLPSVRNGAAGDPSSVIYPGYKCATLALSETASLFGKTVQGRPPLEAFLLAISGWLNPLILIDLLLSPWRKMLAVRRVVGVMVVLCMGSSWWFFVRMTLTPLLGHFLWIAGALLIILPDALPGRGATRA